MDYILIIIFQAIGVAFKVGQQVNVLKKLHPERTGKEIMNTYWNEDWNTLIMSWVVLCTNLAVHYVVSLLGIDFKKDFTILSLELSYGSVYLLGSVVVASVLGYKGQDLLYKWLGSAADRLDKEVSEKINKG